jgi:uncharacterized membrane protein
MGTTKAPSIQTQLEGFAWYYSFILGNLFGLSSLVYIFDPVQRYRFMVESLEDYKDTTVYLELLYLAFKHVREGILLYPRLALYLHLFCAAVFQIIGPIQFLTSIRGKYPVLHRWMGRIFLISNTISTITSFFMVSQLHWSAKYASYLYGVWGLICGYMAYTSIIGKRLTEHKNWVLRTYSNGFAVVQMRLLGTLIFPGPAFITVETSIFLGVSFWFWWTVQFLGMEVYIWKTQFVSQKKS